MISTAKLDQDAMDFDQGKSMSKAWEKHVVLKPWDICHKLLGGGMFHPSQSLMNLVLIALVLCITIITPAMLQDCTDGEGAWIG